jgi:hypothetical protein
MVAGRLAGICWGGREPRTRSLEYSICSKSYRSLFVPSTLDAISIPLRADFDFFILLSGRRSCHLTLEIQNTNAASLKILMHSCTSSPLSSFISVSISNPKVDRISGKIITHLPCTFSIRLSPPKDSTLVTNEEADNGVLGACRHSNSEQNRICDRHQRCVWLNLTLGKYLWVHMRHHISFSFYILCSKL